MKKYPVWLTMLQPGVVPNVFDNRNDMSAD
jgi:hypothetical protein